MEKKFKQEQYNKQSKLHIYKVSLFHFVTVIQHTCALAADVIVLHHSIAKKSFLK